jgi:hypothetical protein
MVRINDNKLIIEMEHSNPHEFLLDIYVAIIYLLQNQSEDPINKEQRQNANNTMLEVLKNIE